MQSTGCKGFGMIERNSKILKFKLTKPHNIEYYQHSYYKNTKCKKDLIEGK